MTHAAAPVVTVRSLSRRGRRLRWVILSFIPSSLMLGVTTHISTDVAAVPLLWVLPLAMYLGTFVLAFSPEEVLPHRWLITTAAGSHLRMSLHDLLNARDVVADSLCTWSRSSSARWSAIASWRITDPMPDI